MSSRIHRPGCIDPAFKASPYRLLVHPDVRWNHITIFLFFFRVWILPLGHVFLETLVNKHAELVMTLCVSSIAGCYRRWVSGSGRRGCGFQRAWAGPTWRIGMDGYTPKLVTCGWHCPSPLYSSLSVRSLKGQFIFHSISVPLIYVFMIINSNISFSLYSHIFQPSNAHLFPFVCCFLFPFFLLQSAYLLSHPLTSNYIIVLQNAVSISCFFFFIPSSYLIFPLLCPTL